MLATSMSLPAAAQSEPTTDEPSEETTAPESHDPLDAEAPSTEPQQEGIAPEGSEAEGSAAVEPLPLELEAVPEGDITNVELDQLLSARSGGSGGFGFRLGDLAIEPYVHGYAVIDGVLNETAPFTFDLHYFNVFVGARIGDAVQAEIQLEHEHSEEFAVRFGQVDVRAADWFVVRVGLFLVPFGRYNEYLYPEYLEPVPRGPLVLFMRNVIPVVWNDVGVQVRGTFDLGDHNALGYSVYVINGLVQRDDEATPEIEEGGALRDMRGNFRDLDADKGVGARLFAHGDLYEVGFSFYTGAYRSDGGRRLYMGNVDAELRASPVLVRAAAAYVAQEITGGAIERAGAYVRASWTIIPEIRPALALDFTHTDQTGVGVTIVQPVLGLDVLPWAATMPTTIFRVAGALGFTLPSADPSMQLVFQAMTGF